MVKKSGPISITSMTVAAIDIRMAFGGSGGSDVDGFVNFALWLTSIL
jgi:hypothetical protein